MTLHDFRPMQLHDYQLVARDFLRGRDRAALFLDMGLGKTAASLAALEPRHLPALVVAPKRVAEHVWPHETALWRPDLTVALAAGSPAERAAEIASDADIVVVGRDNLRDIEKVRRSTPFRTLILDELSGFKSRQSVRWKTAHRLTKQPAMKHVWGLTGTPTPNGLLDLWPQVALLDNGARLGKNITTYRSRYFTPGRQLASGVITEWVIREGADAKIRSLVSDICLAMSTEGRINLPSVTYNSVSVTLPPPVERAYKEMQNQLVVDLKELFDGEVHTAKNAAVLTSKLSQIAAGFLYVDEADIRDSAFTHLHNEKINAVREIVDASLGSPVLVFYRFTRELDMLRAAFPEASYVNEPDAVERWNAGEIPVLLAHPASAGHGLNLQYGGHTAVWTSLPWSLEEWEQSNKRLARQGQAHPVVIHTVDADGTVDSLIRKSLQSKTRVQDALLEFLESPI